MEILHKPPEQKKFRVCNPYLELQQLALPADSYRTVVLAPASPKNSGEGWKLEVHVTVKFPLEPGKEIGVKSSKSFTNPLDGSWRRMKVARFPVVVEVQLYVRYADAAYREVITDASGEMTLGGLAGLVEEVHIRREEVHRKLAAGCDPQHRPKPLT